MVQPNPYARGRWYQLFIESDGSKYVKGDCDIEIEISSTYATLPPGFHVVDVIADVTSNAATAANYSWLTRFNADGTQAIILPPKANFTSAYIYVFGYIGE